MSKNHSFKTESIVDPLVVRIMNEHNHLTNIALNKIDEFIVVSSSIISLSEDGDEILASNEVKKIIKDYMTNMWDMVEKLQSKKSYFYEDTIDHWEKTLKNFVDFKTKSFDFLTIR